MFNKTFTNTGVCNRAALSKTIERVQYDNMTEMSALKLKKETGHDYVTTQDPMI